MTPAAHHAAERPSVGKRLDGNLPGALLHAARGRPVFPCRSDRSRPLVKWGAAATTDAGQLCDWWRQWPDALPGIVTGARSDLAVIDLDTKSGEDGISEFARLVARHGPIPATLRVRTPSGGLHLVFRHPGRHVKTCASLIAPGVDVRGDGGFIFAPGAVLSDGRAYRVLRGPDDPAELPEWLAAMIAPPPAPVTQRPVPRPIGNVSRYAAKVLTEEAAAIAGCQCGQEPNLNAVAFRVGRHVASGRIPEMDAFNALLDAGLAMRNLRPNDPWRRDQIAGKIERAFRDAASRGRERS